MSEQTETVRRFYDAFMGQDLDAFVETLHPHVELQTARGLRIGQEEARSWATRIQSGDLEQRFVIDELREHRNHVVAMVRKQWFWKENDELADEERTAALFTFQEGLISRWQPFVDRAEGLRAAGIET